MSTKNVLVVDDDPWIRTMITMTVQKKGCHVEQEDNGASAKSRIEQQQFDLIILDMAMPDMDGLCFLEWLRQTATISTPVLVSTSLSPEEIQEKAISFGATDIIYKPFTFSSLWEKIESMLTA